MAVTRQQLFGNIDSQKISQNNVAIGDKFSYNDKRATNEWLDFIEKRLSLARQILKQDGVIFISIHDNFLYELKILCDKIFGGIVVTRQAVRSNSKFNKTLKK